MRDQSVVTGGATASGGFTEHCHVDLPGAGDRPIPPAAGASSVTLLDELQQALDSGQPEPKKEQRAVKRHSLRGTMVSRWPAEVANRLRQSVDTVMTNHDGDTDALKQGVKQGVHSVETFFRRVVREVEHFNDAEQLPGGTLKVSYALIALNYMFL